jgi:hypothetical protein
MIIDIQVSLESVFFSKFLSVAMVRKFEIILGQRL